MIQRIKRHHRRMDRVRVTLAAIFVGELLHGCSNQPPPNLRFVNAESVYSICRHNDSLYFSTPNDGIHRFHPSHPETVVSVARCGKLPFRAMAFSPGDTLYAISYVSGLHFMLGDSLPAYPGCGYPGWSLKRDEEDGYWFAGTQGVFRFHAGRCSKIIALPEAHDAVVIDSLVYAAYLYGLSVYDARDGRLVKHLYEKTNFWWIGRQGRLLIGGGTNLCVVIDNKAIREVTFAPPGNILWAAVIDGSGALFLATQKGLFRAAPGKKTAACIADKGRCIKTVFMDRDGTLWAGRF
jgi:hypothetical protein